MSTSLNSGYESIPTRRSLLERIQDVDDRSSWREFYHTYESFLQAMARKHGLSRSDAEEVVQTVFKEVAEVFRTGKYDFSTTSFKGWLGGRMKWRILDAHRAANRRGGSAVPLADIEATYGIDTFDQTWEKEWNAHLLRIVMSRAKESPRSLQIFDCLALKGMSVKEVCRVFRISRESAYTIKNRVKSKLESAIQDLTADLDRI